MTTNKDNFGNRMKEFEGLEAARMACPLLPIMIRLDGKGFSKWTKGLKRPFDADLSNVMIGTALHLAEELNASCAYTQSDEISLVLYSDNYSKETIFNGKFQKLVSVSASIATAHFNNTARKIWPDKPLALFDSRAWTVPTKGEAANAFLWRQQDATKNSISMAARHYYSHKELQGKKGSEMQEMLFQKGVNWNDYPDFFKSGTFIIRKKVKTKLSTEQIEKLPKNHDARSDPNYKFERNVYAIESIPRFSGMVNRDMIIFYGEDPIHEDDPWHCY